MVAADIFADGHDELSARLLYRHESESEWREAPMMRIGEDRWRGEFTVSEPGRYRYTVEGWIDRFATWKRDLMRRIDGGQELEMEFQIGAALLEDAATAAPVSDAGNLRG